MDTREYGDIGIYRIQSTRIQWILENTEIQEYIEYRVQGYSGY